ncbi:MAG: tetratricopeptide repeat protein [Bacteroidales bacterium]|nr:tetratricopeptide repeat protein [Bacteroidales bacterium]
MRNYFIILSFLLFSLSSCNDSSKGGEYEALFTKEDSLSFQNILKVFSENYNENQEKHRSVSDSIISLFPNQKALVSSSLAQIHYQKSHFDLASEYFTKSAEVYYKLGYVSKSAEQTANAGVCKEQIGSYQKAILDYLYCVNIFDSLGEYQKSTVVLNNIGIVYQQIENIDSALSFYKKALEISTKIDRKDLSAKRYNNIATLYEEFYNQPDSALVYYLKAHQIYLDIDSKLLPIVENNIGYIYLMKRDISKADSLFEKAYQYYITNKLDNQLPAVLRNKSALALVQKQFSTAINFAKEAIEISKQNGERELQLESMKVLVDAMEASSNWKEANINLKSYYELKDELKGIEQRNTIRAIHTDHELEQKNHLIEILQLKNENQIRKMWMLWLAISLLVIILSGFFWVYRLQKNNTKLQIIQMQRDISDYITQLEEVKEQKEQITKTQHEFAIKNHDQRVLESLKKYELTEREEEVLLLISRGYKNAEIAEKMFVSLNTIKTHTKNIFIKLDVNNRTQAAQKIIK